MKPWNRWCGAMRSMMGFAAAAVLACAPAAHAGKKKGGTIVFLDGQKERVFWNDGDSFRVLDGPKKDVKARIYGYNTLESYGPVHFWGGFNAYELFKLAKQGTNLARSKVWHCNSKGKVDGYGRIIVDCADLSAAMIKTGSAHVFAVDADPDPKLVKAQLEAQSKRLGIWEKGIPQLIVTSIHSTDERRDDPSAASYNRLCDTATGKSRMIKHDLAFKECNVFCWGGSCMAYVPFERRYGKDRAACLREGSRLRMGGPKHVDQLVPRSN